MSAPACPTCAAPLSAAHGRITCVHDHPFTAEGLAIAGNLVAVRALWLAIRALEDDAAGLDWMVKTERAPDHQRAEYARQARAGRDAAGVLRGIAAAAQGRLDRLPVAPSVLFSESAPRADASAPSMHGGVHAE